MDVYIIPLIIILLLVVWSMGTYLYEKHLECPAYSVLEKRRGYELRMYEPYISAETEVTGGYERASTDGFGIISGYIFGSSTRRKKMAMTAPVGMEKKQVKEKISMTVPVVMTQEDGHQAQTYTMSFKIPSKYTLDTLPAPNNPAVKLRLVPKKKVAVIRFSLYANERRVKEKTAELKKALERDDITDVDKTEIARYNAPFSNPLLRRNEILMEID